MGRAGRFLRYTGIDAQTDLGFYFTFYNGIWMFGLLNVIRSVYHAFL